MQQFRQHVYAVSKEGFAAYGYEGYYKVSSVMIISPAADSTYGRGQEKRKSGGQKEFRQMLAEASERQKEKHSMEGRIIGYSRNGQAYISGTEQKTYN